MIDMQHHCWANGCLSPSRNYGVMPTRSLIAAPLENQLTPERAAELELAGQALAADIAEAWDRFQLALHTGDKATVQALHLTAKRSDSSVNYSAFIADFHRLTRYFAQASAITPSKIAPELIQVRPGRWTERLFKIARAYWSMPYSKGYGRRLRFLVMDQAHNALIGIIGLQSPPADLSCRDQYLNLPAERKLQTVNSTLDAYTIGAVPPYNRLIGGKLVAGLLCSASIRRAYWRQYGATVTTQRRQRLPQTLLAITTASAFGRSSIYNRLSFGEYRITKSLGYTKGYGTLHLEHIYPRLADWLKQNDLLTPAGFGNGPKVRWQNISRALTTLGLPTKYLRHGLRREVFITELVQNLREACHGETPIPIEFDDISWATHWRSRWCLPRIERQPDWADFDAHDEILRALCGNAL